MDRYQAQSGSQTRYQPGSNDEVLENKLQVISKFEMDQLEYSALVRAQNDYLEHILTTDTILTATLIRNMHFDWLGEIYDWAGSYRTVNVSKASFKWPPYGFIARSMESLESGLLKRYTPARAVNIGELAKQQAEVHSEFLLIHPFRDGNGRLARWIADIMAVQSGFPLPAYDFDGPSAELSKISYIAAVTAGYQEDFDPLIRFFIAALERALHKS